MTYAQTVLRLGWLAQPWVAAPRMRQDGVSDPAPRSSDVGQAQTPPAGNVVALRPLGASNLRANQGVQTVPVARIQWDQMNVKSHIGIPFLTASPSYSVCPKGTPNKTG